jgi:hypothetical protein
MPVVVPGAGGRPRKKCEICSPHRVRKPKPKGEAPVKSLRDLRDEAPPPPVDETLTKAVAAELGDCSGNVDGVLAMRIARLIDATEPTAAALATLAKQLRAHITAATAGRPAAPDGITAQQDEVARRRAEAGRASA